MSTAKLRYRGIPYNADQHEHPSTKPVLTGAADGAGKDGSTLALVDYVRSRSGR